MNDKLDLLEFDEILYDGLEKVISGGQDGVDLGGLAAAHDCGFNTGGHCPRFFKTCSGPNLDLGGIYGLTESSSTSYVGRTRLNVLNADGTLNIASNFNSPGMALTSRYIKEFNKPALYVKVPFEEPGAERAARERVINWLMINKIRVLNVAGNRDKNMRYGDHYHITYYFLSDIFKKYRELYTNEKS